MSAQTFARAQKADPAKLVERLPVWEVHPDLLVDVTE